MNIQTLFPKAHRKAFTLLEVLVTMAISSLLLITLAALISHTTETYAQSQRLVSHLSQARAFLQLIDSEISVRLPDATLIYDASLSSDSRNADQIAFVRTNSINEQNEDSPGDLVTTCYYIAFVKEQNLNVTSKLFRRILNHSETQNLIETKSQLAFPAVNPDIDEPVIDSVLSFQAMPMYLNPITENYEPWDETIIISPSYLKLMIHTLDESLARRITSQSAWERLAISPKDKERSMIRIITQNISI